MVHVLPNTGIMSDDWLDDLRVKALCAIDAGGKIPDAVVVYIQALEREYLSRLHQQKQQSAEELWAMRAATVTK